MLANINQRGGQNRVPLYDNLKAVGIILVVLGHVTENHILRNFIYSFHMPLFFFISGMLYKPQKHYTLRLARSILWPYFVFATLSFLYWAVVEIRVRPVPDGTSIMEQFTNIFYPINLGKHAHIMNVVLWFLPVLYLCSIAYHYLLHYVGSVKMQLLAIGIITVMFQLFDFWIPLCIPQALCALPLFAMGYLLNDKIRYIEGAVPKTRIILFVISIMFFVFLYLCSPGGDMRTVSYPMGYAPYLVIAICSIIALCMACPRRHTNILCFLGCNSLIIMLLHEPLKRIVVKVYSLVFSMDMDMARESILHSLIITTIVILILYPMVIFIRKYCSALLKI